MQVILELKNANSQSMRQHEGQLQQYMRMIVREKPYCTTGILLNFPKGHHDQMQIWAKQFEHIQGRESWDPLSFNAHQLSPNI